MKNIWNDPPSLFNGNHFSSVYRRTHVRTFLIRMRALVICDRNSIATKREEFPAGVVEVASGRLHFASLALLLQLLQQRYPHYASCMEVSIGSLLITIIKIQVFFC